MHPSLPNGLGCPTILISRVEPSRLSNPPSAPSSILHFWIRCTYSVRSMLPSTTFTNFIILLLTRRAPPTGGSFVCKHLPMPIYYYRILLATSRRLGLAFRRFSALEGTTVLITAPMTSEGHNTFYVTKPFHCHVLIRSLEEDNTLGLEPFISLLFLLLL